MNARSGNRLHAVIMALAALATVGYWIAYFTTGLTHVRADAVYLAFENAFPLADGWMALCFLLGAYYLWRGERTAVLWGISAGSAMIFLGCMDLLFNIEQGHFQPPIGAAMWLEIAIMAFCLTFGPFTIWRLWRQAG